TRGRPGASRSGGAGRRSNSAPPRRQRARPARGDRTGNSRPFSLVSARIRALATRANGHDALQSLALIFFFFSPFPRRRSLGKLNLSCNRLAILKGSYFVKVFESRLRGPWRKRNRRGLRRSICSNDRCCNGRGCNGRGRGGGGRGGGGWWGACGGGRRRAGRGCGRGGGFCCGD